MKHAPLPQRQHQSLFLCIRKDSDVGTAGRPYKFEYRMSISISPPNGADNHTIKPIPQACLPHLDGIKDGAELDVVSVLLLRDKTKKITELSVYRAPPRENVNAVLAMNPLLKSVILKDLEDAKVPASLGRDIEKALWSAAAETLGHYAISSCRVLVEPPAVR